MINGDPHDFIEISNSGQNIQYIFRGKKYWFQGYNKGDAFFMKIYHCEPPYEDTWSGFDSDNFICGEAFQKAPIFDGKTFWEVEDEIE